MVFQGSTCRMPQKISEVSIVWRKFSSPASTHPCLPLWQALSGSNLETYEQQSNSMLFVVFCWLWADMGDKPSSELKIRDRPNFPMYPWRRKTCWWVMSVGHMQGSHLKHVISTRPKGPLGGRRFFKRHEHVFVSTRSHQTCLTWLHELKDYGG